MMVTAPLLIEAASFEAPAATTRIHVLIEGSQMLRTIQHGLALSTAWHPLHAVQVRRVMSAV